LTTIANEQRRRHVGSSNGLKRAYHLLDSHLAHVETVWDQMSRGKGYAVQVHAQGLLAAMIVRIREI
jgi:hypothetical protein